MTFSIDRLSKEETAHAIRNASRVVLPRLTASAFLLLLCIIAGVVVTLYWLSLVPDPFASFRHFSWFNKILNLLTITAVLACTSLSGYFFRVIRDWLVWQRGVKVALGSQPYNFSVNIERNRWKTQVNFRDPECPNRNFQPGEIALNKQLSDFPAGDWLNAQVYKDPTYNQPIALGLESPDQKRSIVLLKPAGFNNPIFSSLQLRR